MNDDFEMPPFRIIKCDYEIARANQDDSWAIFVIDRIHDERKLIKVGHGTKELAEFFHPSDQED